MLTKFAQNIDVPDFPVLHISSIYANTEPEKGCLFSDSFANK